MEQKLYCGKYTTCGKVADTIEIEILDADLNKIETLTMPCPSSSFKDGDFTPGFIHKTARKIAAHYHRGAEDLIKYISKTNAEIARHFSQTKNDPFYLINNADEMSKLFSELLPVNEEEQNVYNFFVSIKENLFAFTKDVWEMDEAVALRMGYPIDYIKEEKAHIAERRAERRAERLLQKQEAMKKLLEEKEEEEKEIA